MAVRRLNESFHSKVWGATSLAPWFPDPNDKIGEVWFTGDPRPPLLVKFLFTTDKLSVQVHPGGPEGKTEMWHILRADPHARIAIGFREPLSPERLREASLSGDVERLLEWFPVQRGQTFFIPAGTVHAIGAGVAICEIQQYSDCTYRLYDYGRPRELHLDEGLPISKLERHDGPVSQQDGLLVACEYFETHRHLVRGSLVIPAGMLIILEGSGSLEGNAIRRGQAWQLDSPTRVEGEMDVLFTRVPPR